MSWSSQSFSPLRFVPLREASKYTRTEDSNRHIDLDTLRVTDEMKRIRSSITESLDKEEWLLEENQEIELPSTHLDLSKKIFSLHDFVIRADKAVLKDLKDAALDDSGKRRMLTEDQVQELHQTGTFSVPSVHLKRQFHIWRVAPWFYSGREPIRDSFWGAVGKALDHLLVYTWSNPDPNIAWLPSWPNTIRCFGLKGFKVILKVVAQFISAPIRPLMYTDYDIHTLLETAENGYVRHHLNTRGYDVRFVGNSGHSDELHNLEYRWDEEELSFEQTRTARTNAQIRGAKDGARRIDEEKKRYAKATATRRQKELDYSSEHALQSQGSAREEAKRAQAAWEKKIEQELIDHFHSFKDPLFLKEAKRLEVKRIEERVEQIDNAGNKKYMQMYEETTKNEWPILSLSNAWLKRRLKKERTARKEEGDASRIHRLVARLEQMVGMESEIEEYRLRLRFRETHTSNLRSTLSRQRKSLTYDFRLLQLNSSKWTLDATSRHVERHRKVKVPLDEWFWRLRCSWYSFLATTTSLMFSSYHFFFNGPLSAKALFSRNAFIALKRPPMLSSGELEDDPTSLTPTLASRLTSFFQALRNDREAFENKPDVSLIDKSLQRVVFRVKALLQGSMGCLIITLFMIIGSILCTALSGLTLLTSPLLASLFVLVQFCSDMLIYDRVANTSGPCSKLLTVLLVYVLPGILHGGIATIRHIAIHPTLGMTYVVWGFGRFFLRTTRDLLTGYTLLRAAKIPVDDSFLAKRTQGPGLSSLTYVRLPLSAAKASVELILQQARVNAHAKFHTAMLLEPFRRFETFLDSLLSPFESKSTFLGHSPQAVCSSLLSSFDHGKYDPLPSTHQHTRFGIWDEIGSSIRRAHPDVKIADRLADGFERSGIEASEMRKEDARIRAHIQAGTADMLSSAESPYAVMSARTGRQLAYLHFRRKFQDGRISRAVALPKHARGKFRLSAAELQDLWEFTLRLTQKYSSMIDNDLSDMTVKSPFKRMMEHVAEKISESFWQESEARPGIDVATVAAHLLSTLFGLSTNQSLEETDEKLVIEPVFSEADDHMIFWESMVQ